ncbi:hypothetical protein FGO68_gene7312 [Halteria grandinella]|uniref:glutathione transferase n=1 Tax=Halteria grandinella TaxID=5974 RepID=A0A8J8NII9_HALGN|nr:hypothetical protein FGO68_gene7312 [Halteria grandinella]
MQSSKKLIIGYWDIRGLAQPIRYLLEYLKVDYEDKKYPLGEAPDFSKEAWFSVKQTLGFDLPNLPYLIDEETGVKITESHAIYRYICNKHNPDLLGKTLQEKANVDMFMSYVQDIRNATYVHSYETGDLAALSKIGFEKFEPIAKYLAKVDGKFLPGGDQVSIADFLLFEQIDMFDYFTSLEEKTSLTGLYPVLGQYYKKMANLEGLKEYLESDRCLKVLYNGKRAKLNKH